MDAQWQRDGGCLLRAEQAYLEPAAAGHQLRRAGVVEEARAAREIAEEDAARMRRLADELTLWETWERCSHPGPHAHAAMEPPTVDRSSPGRPDRRHAGPAGCRRQTRVAVKATLEPSASSREEWAQTLQEAAEHGIRPLVYRCHPCRPSGTRAGASKRAVCPKRDTGTVHG
jgi:hypothetical protein